MSNLELYVNKKFDIYKIIQMVFKRQGWGEKHTLYSTPTHEVLAEMTLYNFQNEYATFKLRINEKKGSGYETTEINIYNNREDYTVDFVNRLFLKTIISLLKKYRKGIFESEAMDLFPYIWRSQKKDDEWVEEANLQDEINEILNSNIADKNKKKLIDNLVAEYVDDKNDRETFEHRNAYIEKTIDSNREPEILSLIDEIEKEFNKGKE